MLREAGLAELGQWAALNRLSPFGEYRADLRNAMLCALFANKNRDRQRRPSPFRLIDFMLFADKDDSADATDERLRGALAGFDGGRTGADLKAWRSAMRKEVGKAKS